MSKRFGMKQMIGLAGAVALLVGVAWAGGGRVFVRRAYTTQTLTDAGASNSTVIALSDFEPQGSFSVEVRLSGTGTVNYINAQVSIDETTWHYAVNVITNTAVSVATGGTPDATFSSLLIPPAPYVRLTGIASSGSPIVDAWIVTH